MTTTIWKFPFKVADVVEIDMPADAVLLKVECQDGIACMWAWVDTSRSPAPRRFRIFGTGHAIPPGYSGYVATFQQGPFVWHVFEDRHG